MNRAEHLLFIAAEESAELTQRISKAARFGLQEIEPGQSKNNAERIVEEWCDLYGVIEMMISDELLPVFSAIPSLGKIEVKQEKVEKFLQYSAELGRLTEYE